LIRGRFGVARFSDTFPFVLLGLCPLIPPDRPAAPATWWAGHAEAGDGDVLEVALDEQAAPPPLRNATRVGLAAPCSLPEEFLAALGAPDVAHLDLTAKRLFAEARRFASRRTRGQRHPLRFEAESASSLERRRLARLHAALPLLRRRPAGLVELDTVAVLDRLGLPAGGWTGGDRAAIDRRRTIVDGLAAGALEDIAVRPLRADYPIACAAALEALVATALAAWVDRRPERVTGGAGIPLP